MSWTQLAAAQSTAPIAAATDADDPAISVAAPPAIFDEPLAEVIVSAPEPRYVAPTRRDRIGRIWAPVYLNGQGPFRLVLDTGANRSAVIPTVATTLGVDAKSTSSMRVRGVTGTAIVPVIRVKRMEIGDLLLEPAMLPVVADVFGGADGVLGNEGLRNKRIVIDFKHDSITVKRSHSETPPLGFQTLPITMLHDHLLAIDVYVGRVKAKAIIDTGAPDSVGNLALLQALKKQVSDHPSTDIIGVTLDVEKGTQVSVPTISMRNVQIRGLSLTFSDVYIMQHWQMISEPTLLLGMDVLGVLQELIIDYQSREVHMLTGE